MQTNFAGEVQVVPAYTIEVMFVSAYIIFVVFFAKKRSLLFKRGGGREALIPSLLHSNLLKII